MEKQIEDILKQYNTTLEGLTNEEAKKRLKDVGKNELTQSKKVQPFAIFLGQFKNLILYVLIAAAGVSLYENEIVSFYVILAVILIVIVLGFIQEYQAERAMAALKNLVDPQANVRRKGALVSIDRSAIVPGDIVELNEGDSIPADGCILECKQFRIDESMLTGESLPVIKEVLHPLFAGTQVVQGNALLLVERTGMKTQLGTIADSVSEQSPKTPLQKNIEHLTRTLAIMAFIAAGATFLFGLWQGADIDEIFLVALALAVAAVPEGLPLTLTMTLARGMKKMATENAIVRKLVSVETLGSITYICTDKTGTLTKNQMTIEHMYTAGMMYDVSGAGYEPTGDISNAGMPIDINEEKELSELLLAGLLASNATLKKQGDEWNIIGDPTEGALVVAAAKAGLWSHELVDAYEHLEEHVFTSERKMMSVAVREHNTGNIVGYAKGAPEVMLERSTQRLNTKGAIVPMTDDDRERIKNVYRHQAVSAYRVLAIAKKEAPQDMTKESLEENLTFLGLVAMIDPPREETADAIETAQRAGITVTMITGDNKHTAKAIAKKVGLFRDGSRIEVDSPKLKNIVEDGVITGDELEGLSDEEFQIVAGAVRVYARIRPEQKLRIVTMLQANNQVVAMTGDGVNDAPALKRADIGISMGQSGTDVAQGASAMVLQDDNFATIVRAVEQGRILYNNIEKFTVYLVSRNFTEIIVIFLGLLTFGVHFLPILAIHILYINLFSEIVPALGLGLDGNTEDVMKNAPRATDERIFNRKNSILMFLSASIMAGIGFLSFMIHEPLVRLEEAQMFTFLTIAIMVLFVPFAFRNIHKSTAPKKYTQPNYILYTGIIISALLLLTVVYTPVLQTVFHVQALAPLEWLVPIALGFSAYVLIQLVKRVLLFFVPK